MDKFKLKSTFQPKGDQPQAIEKLISGLKAKGKHQVLLGVTGSGKTFTIANVLQKTQLPTLIISHNKTLAAQLYQEIKEFFPHNPVSYFVSYYDYYQPEAYIPASDTYIQKEVDINPLIDQLRLEATSNMFGFKRSIVIASVSCIYNIGSPETYESNTFLIKVGDKLGLKEVKMKLINLYYEAASSDFLPGTFRQRGNRLDVLLAYSKDNIVRLFFNSKGLNKIETQTLSGQKQKSHGLFTIYPAKHYLAANQDLGTIFKEIESEMKKQKKLFNSQNKIVEAQRIEKRVNYDLKMIKETGYVNGIENYSRYFDGRKPGDPPFSLLDYFSYCFKNKFLLVVDESHVTIPQIRGMFNGDRSRKQSLIDFGFRLPSALDNRPLRFEEFLKRIPQAIYVSATPQEWEIEKSKGKVIEQLIRPTGLIDPAVDIRPADNQIKDLIEKVKQKKKQGQRSLVITITKQMAEDLASYLSDPAKTNANLKVSYLHADIDTLKRTDILSDLRSGNFDVLVGINLLREGLDLPEVGLVAILEADKQGFLRSKTSLIQIMGRTARNVDGEVILYADTISNAMQEAIEEVERRRNIQTYYNQKHKIIPQSIKKAIRPKLIEEELVKEEKDVDINQLTPKQKKEYIKEMEKNMRKAARDLDFEKAALLRDKILKIK
ncbi:excinuclease ABC subunit UvrB [Patescibacteria group bacterium]